MPTSHHFDTATARDDPRLNLCDCYLFRGRPGTTVMALTVNPNAATSGPDTFHDEARYAFRFDLNGDAREDVTFGVEFGAPADDHEQAFTVHRVPADGPAEPLADGTTGRVVTGSGGVLAFAGLAPDLFAGNAIGLHAFRDAFARQEFAPAAFDNQENFFAGRNVTAIVLEVPVDLIGSGQVRGWATVSLHGHAPETQVSRFGLPLITHLFVTEPALQEDYNRTTPAEDSTRFAGHISGMGTELTGLAGTTPDPAGHGDRLAARLCPTTLPYELDTEASFDIDGFNGRALTDDAMDVLLSLLSNTVLSDGATPDPANTISGFPYFGPPFGQRP